MRESEGKLITNSNKSLKIVGKFYRMLYESRLDSDGHIESEFLTLQRAIVNQGFQEILNAIN